MPEPTYQLLIGVSRPVRVEVGCLGVFDFQAGTYVYTGSARRNPKARIARHLAGAKTLRWHIDYLLVAPGTAVVDVFRHREPECIVNRRTLGQFPVPRFGSGDCRARCVSHLKLLGGSAALMVRLVPAQPGQAETIAELALQIWRRHFFPDVLSEAEITWLWNRNYAPAAIQAEMASGIVYERIEEDDRLIGFLAYDPRPGTVRMRLNKLYLLPEYHGRGIGGLALAYVKGMAAELGFHEIFLYVFRKNAKAVRAYLRAGFVIEREEVTPAGGSYVFDDYVMVCPVTW